MNRLTGRKKDGHAYVIGCPEFKVPQKANILLQSIADKCADIEDILEDTYDLDRLRELVEADKAGRCFVSDTKIGCEVFYIPKFNGKPYCGVKSGHVQAVAFTKAGKRVKIREYHAHNQDFMIGKSVFLTRESAEAALAKEDYHE